MTIRYKFSRKHPCQLTVQQSYPLCWELLPDRNRKSMGLWYWELMSHPDPEVHPVGTLHSLECKRVSRRIFIYSHHTTIVFFSKMSVRPSVGRIVSALYFQQYLPDSFHIYASYQATSDGVSRVGFVLVNSLNL